MSELERVRAAVEEARRLLREAENAQPGGALSAVKSTIAAVVRRLTWHQRAATSALADGVEALLAVGDSTERIRAELDGISEGMARFDERITSLEKRAARTEAMVATLATDLHDLRTSLEASKAPSGPAGG